jgi:hypothetical protein
MPDNKGQSRLDRIEAIIEATATRQADFEDEFRRLLRAQVVMADSIRELASETTRRFRDTDERLSALIKIVDDIARKRPPNQGA